MAVVNGDWGLNDQQYRFVEEYLRNGCNGKQAAIAAGYSVGSAEPQASRLLSDDKVKAYKEFRAQEIAKRLDISAERIAIEYAKIAFGLNADVMEIVGGRLRIKDTVELDDDARALISEASEAVSDKGIARLSIKTYSRLEALAALNKMLGYNKGQDKSQEPTAPVIHVYLPDNATVRHRPDNTHC